ncbi:A/G-specific adenine glycosylase [uncultured Bifidobacterium sp.]|uniref:A/G-specific adenine glycosylase n=1 Tax=uncultured Bifidobacterium sp. TaxID=165187 RepID=UPI0028DD1A3A|nr:A/G-specific adenine glycosylase [uncultured Bifidobacterium sp.]
MADTVKDSTPGGGGAHRGGGPSTAADGAVGTHEAGGVAAALATWWGGHARDLPWRFGRTTPWGVLVSEVMSQQTPMSRVVPYWTAWMHDWPDPASLAAATTAEVITAWGHLGYPRRALRLRECAGVVCGRHGGRLPDSYEALVALPGIGDYTASAVMSFASGRRIVVMDTNIRRVLSRVFLGEESTGGAASRRERGLAEEVLPRDAGGSVIWNQSVMELGAMVCTARTPDCAVCPLASFCGFLAAGRPGLGERRTRPRQRFEGTDRQVRGLVLRALREAGKGASLSRADREGLWGDRVQLESCVASLDEDGLVEILADGSVRLPLA